MRRTLLVTACITVCLATVLPQTPGHAAPRQGGCDGHPGTFMLWNVLQGRLPVSSPQDLLPGPGWVLYGHPVVGYLAFHHPPGWTPQTVAQQGVVGVRLRSPRGDALWDLLAFTQSPITNPRQAAAYGIQSILGDNARQSQLMCVGAWQNPAAAQRYSVIMVSYGPYIVASYAITMPYSPGFFVYHGFAGPAQQFASLVQRVFLVLEAQLLMAGGTGSGTGSGDDGDKQKSK
jgi:hypothetical protein